MGLDPQDNGYHDNRREGSAGDHDGDRLTNREEYLLGTHPCLADSDRDGVDDGDEVRLYGSNPTKKDASPPVLVATLPLSGHLFGGSRWVPLGKDGAILSASPRGDTTWEFEIEKAGVYRIDLSGHSVAARAPSPEVPVSVKVDGIRLGEGYLAGGPALTRLSFMTSWLGAGRHTVTMTNHNVRAGVSLAVVSLQILAQTGDDLNGNGLPDWLESYYLPLNKIQVRSEGHATSPACIEGAARFFEDLTIRDGDDEIVPSRGIGKRWFANVPLDPSGKGKPLKITYEGGVFEESPTIAWKATNLLDGVERRFVRLGDSMRLTAHDPLSAPAGSSFRLSSDGSPLHEGPSSEPWVMTFDAEGDRELEVEVSGPDGSTRSAKVTIAVIDTDLGPDFHVPANFGRKWIPRKLAPEVRLESDENLTLTEIPWASGEPRSFEAMFSVTRGTSGRALARLPDGGAVLDTAVLHGFFLAPSTWTGYHKVIRTLADGTRVVRIVMIIDGEIPPDLSLWMQMYVPDAVFANGGSWLHLTAADFDENGRTEIDIYKAPGDGVPYVCHWIRPFSDGPGETGPDGEPLSSTQAELPTEPEE